MTRYPQSLRHALRRLSLDDNVIAPQGVYSRPAVRPAVHYMPYGVQFAWDVPYSAYALAKLGADPQLTRGFVENMLEFALLDGPDRGMIPRAVTLAGDQAGQDGSQCPMLAWTTLQLHLLSPNEGFLRRTYPALAAAIDWWQSPRRDFDGDGLSEYAGSTPTFVSYESGHDYSPERDLVMAEPTDASVDGFVHEPFADVFLNSCLYAELDALGRIAEVCDPNRSSEWFKRRDLLKQRMTELMWDQKIGGFWPVIRRDLSPSQQRIYRHTPALLQPLWAGLATPEQARRTVDLLIGHPRGYPNFDGTLEVRLGSHLYRGYQVLSDRGLHPSRGQGSAAGGVELRPDSLVMHFGHDRGPSGEVFSRLVLEVDVSVTSGGALKMTVVDNAGHLHADSTLQCPRPGTYVSVLGDDPIESVGEQRWISGLQTISLEYENAKVTAVRVRYSRRSRTGLLSTFGIKSAHPLDGKHPALGVPSEFWSGTIWGPHQFHSCEGLRRYGYDDLARAIARAFCDATAASYAAGGDVFEHISHENGQGLGTSGYTWGGGTALILMQDFIDDEC